MRFACAWIKRERAANEELVEQLRAKMQNVSIQKDDIVEQEVRIIDPISCSRL